MGFQVQTKIGKEDLPLACRHRHLYLHLQHAHLILTQANLPPSQPPPPAP
jgi:hypothetical protein